MKDGRSPLTEPLFNDFEHSVPDLGAAIVIVRVMERFNNLTDGQYGNFGRLLVFSTLLITSSGFELFDQAFNQIQNATRASGALARRTSTMSFTLCSTTTFATLPAGSFKMIPK